MVVWDIKLDRCGKNIKSMAFCMSQNDVPYCCSIWIALAQPGDWWPSSFIKKSFAGITKLKRVYRGMQFYDIIQCFGHSFYISCLFIYIFYGHLVWSLREEKQHSKYICILRELSANSIDNCLSEKATILFISLYFLLLKNSTAVIWHLLHLTDAMNLVH